MILLVLFINSRQKKTGADNLINKKLKNFKRFFVAKLFFSENSFFFPYWKGRNYLRDKKISQEFNSYFLIICLSTVFYFQQDEKVMSWAAVSQFKRSGCNNCTLFFTLELLEEFLAV